MGVWDFYCKICGGPFYYPEDTEEYGYDDDGEMIPNIPVPGTPQFEHLFSWVSETAVIYPDGRVVLCGGYITNDGATTIDDVTLSPEGESMFWGPEDYWKGLAVHRECLNVSGLTGSHNYNRLFFDGVFMGSDSDTGRNATDIDKAVAKYADQEFEWEAFLTDSLTQDVRYLLEDPKVNLRNRQRIVDRSRFTLTRQLTPVTALVPVDPVPPDLAKVLGTGRYMVEAILEAREAQIQELARILKTSPDKGNVLREMKKNNLLIGSYQDITDQPELDKEVAKLGGTTHFRASDVILKLTREVL